MFTLQYFDEEAGCPKCSHPRAEVHEIESDGGWDGRCPKCGAELFGTLFVTGIVQEKRIDAQSERLRQKRQAG
jgi:predicted nucleic-acid-binding Zn-ribbon protein